MSYGRGHVRTTRLQRASASDWFCKIEAASLVAAEAAWQIEHPDTPEEVPQLLHDRHDDEQRVNA